MKKSEHVKIARNDMSITDHRHNLTNPRYTLFFAELAVDGNVSRAASVAGVDRSNAYQMRLGNEDFAAAWTAALEQAADRLEEEARRRAVDGVAKRIYHQGQPVYRYRHIVDEDGQPVVDENGRPVVELMRDAAGQPVQEVELSYSDSLLTTLLKANNPAKFRERVDMDLSGTLQVEESPMQLASRVAFLLQQGMKLVGEGPTTPAIEAETGLESTNDDSDGWDLV